MKTAWQVITYVQSELPLTSKVPAVLSLTLVILDEKPPSEELVRSLVESHTRNCVLLMSEVKGIYIPDDLLPSD